MIEVNFIEDAEGYITIIAYRPHQDFDCMKIVPDQTVNENDSDTNTHRMRLRRSGSIEIESPSEDESSLFEEINNHTEEDASGNKNISSSQSMNPWVLKCHREQLKKLMKGASSGTKSKSESN